MSDQLVGWLRTVVPATWSAFVTWLATLAVPNTITGPLGQAGELVVAPIVIAIVYPLLRAVEAHLPDWLTRVLLGSCKVPTYRKPDTP
ncbi:hypothetical protein [Actinocrispum wychmicini]|uniref:Uncharacterized protein n=1 Tax=Actinocrispum wychmicini TaxID=1213861 RepID=A0A4R2K3P9_9PSEU|nr:hypothetical protein [Actinocrispum wychmicini]TCO64399.1 hypothetical protein EV192_101167 [Actinocrispum wychmicini]